MTARQRFSCDHPNYLLENLENLLVPVGVVVTFCLASSVVTRFYRFFYVHLLRQYFPPSVAHYGPCAVITGGSSGIGRNYAFELAQRGTDLVLISDEPEALRTTAQEIESSYGVKCSYLEANLTEKEVFPRLREELKGKEVGILVNNAGVTGKLPCDFLNETEENMLIMIGLHVTAVVNLTHALLPSMLERNKGAIVTVSSFSSLNPMPRLSIYSACKAFSDRFTRGLSYEYSHKDVRLQSLIPSYVSTRMIKFMSVKFLVPSGRDYAERAINTLGVTSYTTGYWLHEIMSFWLPFFPTSVWKHFLLKTVFRVKKFFSFQT